MAGLVLFESGGDEGRARSMPQDSLQLFRLSDRCLTSEVPAHIGHSTPVTQATVLQERNSRGLGTSRAKGYDLEGSVAVANEIQQGMCICGVGITDDGNLPWLRQGIRKRLEPLAKAQRILGQYGLHLAQRLMSDIDITKVASETSQLLEGSDSHRIS
jgi:hypothetical protein